MKRIDKKGMGWRSGGRSGGFDRDSNSKRSEGVKPSKGKVPAKKAVPPKRQMATVKSTNIGKPVKGVQPNDRRKHNQGDKGK